MFHALSISLAMTLAAAQSSANPPSQTVPNSVVQPQIPPPEAQLILIRTALVTLNDANRSNNYSILHALGSSSFRQANPPMKLATAFQGFRQNSIDLSPVVVIQPRPRYQTVISKGQLRMVGSFPSQPMEVAYDLTYDAAGAGWVLSGMSVQLENKVAAR
jgi:hypothetical protein